MLTKIKFQNLSKDQKEHLITAFFKLKFPGFQAKSGISIDVPAGYTVRVAAQLIAEEENQVIKKIFVITEEYNTYISKVDIDAIVEHAEQLKDAGVFKPERDELWLVSNQKWTYEAYAYAKGKIVLLCLDDLIEGINKVLDKEDKKAIALKKTLAKLGVSV